MKAAIYQAFRRPLTVEEVPDPVPAGDGVVIRVMANGICRSDWHGWMGNDPDITPPHVPGHELAGVIEAVGRDVARFRQGDRVTVPFVGGCGSCPQCRTGNHQVCDRQFQPGFTHWGAFAELVAVGYADTNLVHLPDEVEFATAASLGCRFATSFRAVVAQGAVRPGQWVAIHGCGGIGLSAIMIAAAIGATVIGVDIRDDQLQLARSIGAAVAIDAQRVDDVAEAVREASGGGAHVSIDALGTSKTAYDSIACLRKRGRHVQVGLMVEEHRDAPVPMDRVMSNELEIVGSHGMQAYAYGDMLRMIVAGVLRPERLIGKRVTLEEAPAELAAMASFTGTGVTVIDRF